MPLAATAWPPPAPPRRRRTWLRVLLWLLLAAGVLVAAFLLWLASVLSGGLDDLLSGSGPDADDARVVEARERTQDSLDDDRDELVDGVVAPVLGRSAPVAHVSDGSCQTGQHNWKIDDPFDLSCTEVSAVVVVGDTAVFREQVLALHERLLAAGWRSGDEGSGVDRSSLEARIVEYWDARASFDREAYGPADLPSASYVREGRALEVEWAGPGQGRVFAPPLYDPVLTTPDGREVTGADVGRLVPSGAWGAALVLSETSFEE